MFVYNTWAVSYWKKLKVYWLLLPDDPPTDEGDRESEDDDLETEPPIRHPEKAKI